MAIGLGDIAKHGFVEYYVPGFWVALVILCGRWCCPSFVMNALIVKGDIDRFFAHSVVFITKYMPVKSIFAIIEQSSSPLMWYTCCFVIGLLLLIASLFMLKKSIAFLKNSERTVATVIRIETVSGSDGNTYKPIFSFKTNTNEEIIYPSPFSSSPPGWDIGDEATIAYDRNQPNNAKVLTYFGAFSWTIILMSIAMPLLVIGGGYHLAQKLLHGLQTSF